VLRLRFGLVHRFIEREKARLPMAAAPCGNPHGNAT
jgi:hypothetical protein